MAPGFEYAIVQPYTDRPDRLQTATGNRRCSGSVAPRKRGEAESDTPAKMHVS